MTQSSSLLDIHGLAAQSFGRVYRLALLVAGDSRRAADLTVQTFAALPDHTNDPEFALARGVLVAYNAAQRVRPTWRPTSADVERSAIGASQEAALFATLWKAPAAARLLLGLHMLWGLTPSEAAVAADQPDELLFDLRSELAVAGGFVPDSDRATLTAIARLLAGMMTPEEAAAIRGRMLTDPEVRALRDGLLQSEQELRRSLPTLFAAPPPDNLLDRIDRAVVHQQPSQQQNHRAARFSPKVTLTAVVLLLIAALLIGPLLWSRTTGGSGSASSLPTDPAVLVEAAIHRFDQPTIEEGVLHEVHRGTFAGQTWRQERWYDFSPPHRLRVALHNDEDDAPIYLLTSDGDGRVQYGMRGNWQSGTRLREMTATLSSDEAREVLPILRQQPDSTFFGNGTPPDLGRFYLAQARASTLNALGATTFLGRAAILLSYNTDFALPAQSQRRADPQPGRVVLTIDRATSSLLDVTVLLEGAGEGAALHPWRAELFEIQQTVADSMFAVEATNSREQADLPNPRAPFFFNRQLASLEALLGQNEPPFYVPEYLPEESMRGLVLGSDSLGEQPAIVFEGEFRSIVIVPAQEETRLPPEASVGQAGRFSYRLASLGMGGTTPISVATALDSSSGEPLAEVYLLDQFATPDERTATLNQIVGSLQPLTPNTIDALSRPFYRPAAAGGEGR